MKVRVHRRSVSYVREGKVVKRGGASSGLQRSWVAKHSCVALQVSQIDVRKEIELGLGLGLG